MKTSPMMQQVVQQLTQRYNIDLGESGAFLRLDQPCQDSLVIDHVGTSQIAVAMCFVEAGEWKVDREVIFFTGCANQWIPIEVTQSATGWTAYAKLDANCERIVRVNYCGQEKLAEFTERWAHKLMQQQWLEQGTPHIAWVPPTRKELL